MPEGHVLRRLALGLTDAFGGREVQVSSPQGRFAPEAALLNERVLVDAESFGKLLFIEFDGEQIVYIHLGLIGKLQIVRGAPSLPHPVGQVRLRIALEKDDTWSYADLRGAMFCELISAQRRNELIDALGPDPLRDDADWTKAWARIRTSNRTIGDLLMDQRVVAGPGNIFRAEVLFRHGIHPLRPGRMVKRSQVEAMWADLVELMDYAAGTGRIDTVRDEHTPESMGRDARDDPHGGEVYVYRRAGQPCLVCGTEVRTDQLAGRNSYWCPRCQRAPRRPGG